MSSYLYSSSETTTTYNDYVDTELLNKDDLPYLYTPIYNDDQDLQNEVTSSDTSSVYTPSLLERNLKVTIESLIKNIASYNYDVDASDSKYHIKTFYLEDNKTIKIIVDMREKDHIVYYISGDTGYDKVLIKEIIIEGSKIYALYKEGDDNDTS